MRGLSFADQVQALSAVVCRNAVEAAERRESDARRVATIVAAKRAKKPFLYDAILAVMKPATPYRWAELHELSGLPRTQFATALTNAMRNRLIDKTPEGRSSFYSLP